MSPKFPPERGFAATSALNIRAEPVHRAEQVRFDAHWRAVDGNFPRNLVDLMKKFEKISLYSSETGEAYRKSPKFDDSAGERSKIGKNEGAHRAKSWRVCDECPQWARWWAGNPQQNLTGYYCDAHAPVPLDSGSSGADGWRWELI
jgi:hypothetical protein